MFMFLFVLEGQEDDSRVKTAFVCFSFLASLPQYIKRVAHTKTQRHTHINIARDGRGPLHVNATLPSAMLKQRLVFLVKRLWPLFFFFLNVNPTDARAGQRNKAAERLTPFALGNR